MKKRFLLFMLIFWGSCFLCQEQIIAHEFENCIVNNDLIDKELRLMLRANTSWLERNTMNADSLAILALGKQGLTCSTQHDTLLARVHHNLGLAYHNNAYYRKASKQYKKAIQLRDKHLAKNHADIIKSYNNLGQTYLSASRNGYGYFRDSAVWALETSIELNFSRKSPTKLFGTTNILRSRAAEDLGDFEYSRKYLLAAIQQLRATQSSLLPVALNDLAFLLATSLDEPESAIKHTNEAIRFFDEIRQKSRRDSNRLGDLYVTAGIAYMQQGAIQKALDQYESALQLKNPYVEDQPEKIADIYNNMAIAHMKNNSYRVAKQLLASAITLNQIYSENNRLAENHDNLGDAFFKTKDYEEALEAYHQAIINSVPHFSSPNYLETPRLDGVFLSDPRGFITSLYSKAKTLHYLYQRNNDHPEYLLASYHSFMSLDTFIQNVRKQYQITESKERFVSFAKPMYESAINVCFDLAEMTNNEAYYHTAFGFAEKSKSMILSDVIQETNAIKEVLSESIQENLTSIISRKLYYESLDLEDYNGITNFSPLDSVNKYILLESRIMDTVKILASWVHAQQIPTVHEVQRHIISDPNQGVIEYFVGESSMFIFLIGKDFFRVKKWERDSNLNDKIEELRQSISQQSALDDIAESARRLHHSASDLYQILIQRPLGDIHSLPDRWIIIRDDILGLIPFEVLITNRIQDATNFPEFPYLIKQKSISYAYSAALHYEFMHNPIKPLKTLIGFAPIQFQALKHSQSGSNDGGLFDLGNTEHELKGISVFGGEDHFFNEHANSNAFIEQAKQYWIVYLATHGLLNQQDPRRNGIAFHDIILTASDLFQLELEAELVILRACESGTGNIIPGEGIASISRGFAHTGAKSIFSTQWRVREATVFMEIFMKEIESGKSKDEALQYAKLKLLANKYPHHWAAYEISGDVRVALLSRPSIEKGYKISTWFCIMLIVIALILISKRYQLNIVKRSSKDAIGIS